MLELIILKFKSIYFLEDCTSDVDCTNGKCVNSLCMPICSTNQDCIAFNMTCNSMKGVCEKIDEVTIICVIKIDCKNFTSDRFLHSRVL